MLKQKSTQALLSGALLLAMTGLAPATARGQSGQNSTPAPAAGTTNLGTIVVAPQKAPNAASAGNVKIKVKRSALNFGTPRPAATPVQKQTPAQGKPSEPAATRPVTQQPVRQQAVTRNPPRPLHVVPPQYPARAYADGRKGSVTVGFTIAKDGTTRNIHILESDPPGLFDAAARDAVSQWLFRPATENGKPVSINVSQTLVFQPPANARQAAQQQPTAPNSGEAPSGGTPANSVPSNIHPTHLVAPQYPPNAYRTGRGGEVTVKFVVGRNGRTRDIQVVDAKPRHIFDTAAKNAVRQWRFKPVDQPTTVVQTIRFTPPD